MKLLFKWRFGIPTCLFIVILSGLSTVLSFAQEKEEPIIVNGDMVEHSTDKKEVSATGNVVVTYKDTKLTCQKLTVDTQTKDGLAQGDARLEDEGGVTEGSKIIYNFQTKKGVIIDSEFRSNPYFGKAEKTQKVSEAEFIARRGYMTTCNYDKPHYRIKSRRINFFPGDKIQTKDDYLYVGRVPLFYLPQYNHSLKDPLMHVQFMPGKSKEWGAYVLSAWRYSLSENLRGRIYLDYRDRRGIAEGFGLNYTTNNFGKGDIKYYYMQERPRVFEEGEPSEFQRYFVRWRHKWDIDERTNLISQYYKIVDSKRILQPGSKDFLQDYFFREYEKDAQPLSYITLHRSFDYSSLDILLQKRTNRWYSQEEKIPEIKYSFPSYQIGDSLFYFQNDSSYVNSNTKSAVPSDSWNDTTKNEFATTNKLSLPTKASIFQLTPSVSAQQTYSDKTGAHGSSLTNVFSGGTDISTKFYRIFNVKSNFLGLDINNLRHIITPTTSYSYTHTSTMPSSNARFGGGASVGNGSASFELSNKFQTKRKDQSVDLADFRISSTYAIKPESGTNRKSRFSDFLFELDLLPYSWLRINADTTYDHYNDYFSGANWDINLDFGEERSIGLGQRYYRKGGNEITLAFNWRFSPKWKFSFYQRRNRGHDPTLKRGLREQEYSISRDLHCWTVDFTYNQRRGEGETVWLVFRLKAFPEIEFEYNKMYHAPKPGSQSNP